jgi:gas vesicle protein
MRRRHNSDNGYLMGSILGGALAATVTYFLYGTETGERKRREITNAAVRAKDKALDLKDAATGELGAIFSEIQADITDIVRKNKNLVKNLDSEEIAELKERLLERWEDAKEDILETLEEAQED